MKIYNVNKGKLAELFNLLIGDGYKILAPIRKQSGKVFFDYTDDYEQIENDFIQTQFSAKSVVFPKVEELFSFHKTNEGIDIHTDFDNIPKIIVWGLRPCDASAFDYLSQFFLHDNPDIYFAKRRANTTLIAFSCAKSDEACFCTSVGLHPGSSIGSDILFTVMNDDIYVEVITEKGDKIIENAKGLFEKSDNKDKTPYLATIDTHFSIDEIKLKIQNAYNNAEWKHESMGCFGCGACAFACPTCTCFDIQDEGTQNVGKRLRCWDACGLSQFTKHASGHNPRANQTERRRQRLMHKFKYSVENLNIVSCVGCGRCIRVCPSHINIFENILSVTTT